MKIGFISLGCAKNLVDSETMIGMLKAGGHTFTENAQEAEAIIVNTCGFIQSAKEEAINTILEMASYKETGLKKLIVVGCLSTRYKKELEIEMPEVDRFVTIPEYAHLHEILAEELGNPLPLFTKSERAITSAPWTAYLKIAEGCSNRCTYCAIPLIRGGNVSYPMETIVAQAKELADKGTKELVVIAQDTTKYGIDRYHRYALLDLLKELNAIEGLHWIRILYMYPDEINDELLWGMKALDKVIPYFDIPMQHANNRLLKKMNRRGTKEDALALIAKIRSIFDRPILRTTYIVGFPSESEAEFEELLQFTKAVRWDSMGAFTYSAEEDTIAYDFDEPIDEALQNERLSRLMEVQKAISLKNHQALIGETLEVLIERKEDLWGHYFGRSVYQAPDDVDGKVIVKSLRPLAFGSFVRVKIVGASPYDLTGEVLDD